MSWRSLRLAFGCLAAAACGPSEPPEDIKKVTVNVHTPAEDYDRDAEDEITAEFVDKVARLLRITSSGRLTPLIREAERYGDFQSNFGNQSHSRHWFLLRRVGVDPVRSLRETLNQPYGMKRVGNENWFIWPDFAAKAPEELIPESLSFQDRARLRELVGDEGIGRIRSGEPYPGVRLAISETGRWVYFIHDIDTVEDE